MMQVADKKHILQQLQKDILSMQGFKSVPGTQRLHTGLGPIEQSFPYRTFPTGAVHEFLSNEPQDAAATSGFMTAILSTLMQHNKACLWIGTKRMIFPPALKFFDIDPERIVFIDLNKTKDILWAVEEALKCETLAAVVGELNELSFTESRRLQLAVERSRVTGFIHRYQPENENTVACITRWKIKPIASEPEDAMPGVGFPRWDVRLLKVRNGKPGAWQLEWAANSFVHIKQAVTPAATVIRKAG